MDVASRVHELVEPAVAAEGLVLVEVCYTGSQLQVFVDGATGVDLDRLSALSTRLSRLLDQHDPVPGRYTLEVSSPGLERPLRTPDQFRRFVGSTVSVKTKPHVAGERRERGVLEAADDEGIVVLALDGPAHGEARRLAYDQIDRARTVFEWGPPPKPGKARANKPPKKPAGKVRTR